MARSDLTAGAVSRSQVNLVWHDNSGDEADFRIERKVGSLGTWSELTTLGANNTTYANTGLNANTTYFYRLRACNAAGCSAYSNENSATTPLGAWKTLSA